MSASFFDLHLLFKQAEPTNIQPKFGFIDQNNSTHVLFFFIFNLILISILVQQYISYKNTKSNIINIAKFSTLACFTSLSLGLNIIFISNLFNAYL
ncbi:hypothetical protein DAHU10_014250 [Hanseniaspora uvarum]|nr:hypothetical protein DAHU10_014250 [Hanseniaspora uvarum]